MKLEQRALRFSAGGNVLVGIVDVPERALARGLLLLHASSGCRTGEARQFTMLSRLLAGRGVAVLRFDRGACGDSSGTAPRDDSGDIAAAMKELFTHVPELKETVILAAGDAASAALAHAEGDPRVAGLVLLQPVMDGAGPIAAGSRPLQVLALGATGPCPAPPAAAGLRVRRVGLPAETARAAWREAAASACASWLTSW